MTDEGCQTDGLEYSDEMQEFFRQSQAAGREARPPQPPGLQDTRMEFTEDRGERQPVPPFDAFPPGHAQPVSHGGEPNGATAQWPESIFRDMGFSNGSVPDMNLRSNLQFEQPRSHSPQVPPAPSLFENYQENARHGHFQAPYPPDQPMELHHGLSLDHHYGEHTNEAPDEARDSTTSQFAQPAESLYPELPDVSMEAPAQPAWESLTHIPGEIAPTTFEIPNAQSREASAPRYSQPSTPKYRLNGFGHVVETNEGEEESEEESEEGDGVDHRQVGLDEEMEEDESGEEIEIGSGQAPEQYYRQQQFPDEQGGVAPDQRYSNEGGESELDEEDQPSEEEEFSDDDEGSEMESGEEAPYAREGEEFEEDENFDEDDEEPYDDEDMSEEDLGPAQQQQQQTPAVKAEPVFIDLLSSDDEEEQPKPEPKPPLVHKESNFADVEDNVQDNVMGDEELYENAEAEYDEESEEDEMAIGLQNDEESEESEESEGSEGPELEAEEPSDATEVWQPGTPRAAEIQNEVEMKQVPAIALQPDQPKPDNANLSMVEEVGGYEDEDDTMEGGLVEQRFMDGANELPTDLRTAKEKTPASTPAENVQVKAAEEEVTEGGVAKPQPQPVEMELDQEIQVLEVANIRASLDEQLQAKQLEDEQLEDEQLEEEELEEEQLEEELKEKDTSSAEVREDASLAEVTYPSLPRDESSTIETQKTLPNEPQQEEESTADVDDSELINAQLMTPDATQITTSISQDASFNTSTKRQLQNDVTADKVVTDEVVHSSVEGTEPIKETLVEVTKRVTRSAKATTDTLQPPVTPTFDKKMSLRSATSPVSARTDRSPSLAEVAPSTRKDCDSSAHLVREALSPSEKPQPSPQTPKHNLRSKLSTSPTGTRITRSQDRAEAPTTPKASAAILPAATRDLMSPPKQLPTTPQKPSTQPLSETALRASLAKALRTNLSDFTPLKVLRHNLGKRLDVLAIATSAPPEAQRAKHGPRHYHLRFNVTDPSIAPNGVVEIQVFRPYKEALPDVEVGDGVLLRNFSVKAEKDKGFALRSEDSSSWAVFKRERVTECRGPPVEIGKDEEEHVARLKEWWGSRGEEFMARLGRVGESPGSAKGKTRARGA